MTRAVTGAVTIPPHTPLRHGRLSAPPPPAEAPPRRPLVFSFLSSLSSSLTTRARARQRHPHHPPVRPDDGALCARGSRRPPPPARARERARPRPPSGDIVTRRHDDADLGWQAAAAAPRVTEPPNPNPNDARMARMTRDPPRASSPNPPPHARERARPTSRPPPRPSPRPSPRRPTGRHADTNAAAATARASERRAASGGRRPAGVGRAASCCCASEASFSAVNAADITSAYASRHPTRTQLVLFVTAPAAPRAYRSLRDTSRPPHPLLSFRPPFRFGTHNVAWLAGANQNKTLR